MRRLPKHTTIYNDNSNICIIAMNGGGMFATLFRREAVKNGTKRAGSVTSDTTQSTVSTITTPKSSASPQNASSTGINRSKKSIFRTTAPGAWVSDQRPRILMQTFMHVLFILRGSLGTHTQGCSPLISILHLTHSVHRSSGKTIVSSNPFSKSLA